MKATWTWVSSVELRFVPEAGALPWGTEVTVALAEAVPLAGVTHALAAPFATVRARAVLLRRRQGRQLGGGASSTLTPASG